MNTYMSNFNFFKKYLRFQYLILKTPTLLEHMLPNTN